MKNLIFLIVLLITTSIAFSQGTVKGTVVDDDKFPIPSANITIKGTTLGTVTNFDGEYILEKVELNQILVFSYIGFTTQEIVYTGQETLDVQLITSAEALEEIVVVGYGTQKRELVSGAFSTVKSEDIIERNPVQLSDALQGTAAGVQVTSSSGSPGSGFNIRIRGVSTNGDNSPLIIVDGVIFAGGLDLIDPNDIQNLDIIKDSSTAIYGVRGTNGVILITTKSGKKNSKAKFSFNSTYQIQEASNQLNLMNASEYATYLNESQIADGNPIPYPNIQGLGTGTDWQDELFETAPIVSTNLSVSGGSENMTYSFTGNFLEQDGIIASDKSNFARATIKNNLSIDLTDKLKLNTLILFSNLKRRTIPESGRGSVLYYAANASPLTPVFDGTDGSGPSGGFSYLGQEQGIEMINPFAVIDNTFNEVQVNSFSGKIELEYEVIENLKATSRFGYNYSVENNRFYNPLQYYGENKVQNNVNVANGEFVLDTNNNGIRDVYSTVSENVIRNFSYTWESFLTYDKSFGDHNFSGLLGTSLQSDQFRGIYTSGFLVNGPDSWKNAYLFNTQSFIFDEGDNPNGDEDINVNLSPATGINEDRLYSVFGRVQYDYQGKYLFSGMVRRDASTRFGPDNRFGYFPSFSGGWVISKEDFFTSEKINSLKFRGSWGITGNDRIGSYRWLGALQGAGAEATYPFGNTLAFGNALGALSNPSLQWETTTQTNFGVDMIFLDRKFNISLDYFYKRTDDLLTFTEVSGTLGTSAGGSAPPIGNAGTVVNQGVDLSVNFSHDFSDDFSIQVGYNLTAVRNETVQVNNEAGFFSGGLFDLSQTTSRFQTGLPLGTFWGLKTDGIFQNQAEIDAHAVQPDAQPGDIRYVDIDGDGVIEFGSEDDLTAIGNPIPDVTMGLNININYKQFDFGTSLYASIGNDAARSYERFLPFSNRPTLYLDRWTGPGTSNTVPRASTNAANNRLFSDFFVEDASYLRIQNVQLGYSLPQTILEKMNVDRFRIYVAVNNLHTFTKYQGFNPDVSNANPTAAGVDLGQYPLARTIITGINVSF